MCRVAPCALFAGPLIVTPIKLKYLAKTPRAIADVFAGGAGFLQYSRIVPASLFVATVGLVYSAMQPLVCVAACMYFGMSVLVWQYNTVYVFKRPFETGGLHWVRWCAVLPG